MARSRELKKRLHSPPSVCRLCGEQHYVGFEHICIQAFTGWEKVGTGSVPTTKFELHLLPDSTHGHRIIADLNWVQASRILKDHHQGSTKQIFEMLNNAKEKADNGPLQTEGVEDSA